MRLGDLEAKKVVVLGAEPPQFGVHIVSSRRSSKQSFPATLHSVVCQRPRIPLPLNDVSGQDPEPSSIQVPSGLASRQRR